MYILEKDDFLSVCFFLSETSRRSKNQNGVIAWQEKERNQEVQKEKIRFR